MARHSLLDDIVGVLAGGARARDEVPDAVHVARGGTGRAPAALRQDVDQVLQFAGAFTELADGLVYVPHLLDGTSWVAPVDSDDADGTSSDGTRADGSEHDIPGGYVRVQPHFSPLGWWLIDGSVALVDSDGNEIDLLDTDGIWLDDSDVDVIYASEGWLDEVGRWMQLTVRDETIEMTSPREPPPFDAAQMGALSDAFDAASELHHLTMLDDEPVELRLVGLDQLIHTALYDSPEAFRSAAIAPLPDLLGAAGFELRKTIVARAGFDWDSLRVWQRRNRYRTLYELDDDQIDRLVMMLGAVELYGDQGDAALGATDEERVGALTLFATILDDAAVAGAFQAEVDERVPLATVTAFVGEIVALFDGTDVELPGLAWMHAACLEAGGDVVAADTVLRAGVTTSTTHALALSTAARFAADRGDAPAAHQLLVRASVEPYEPSGKETFLWSDGPSEAQRLLDEVAPYVRRRPRREVGRNELCPCGSGRKYKACHLGKAETPLDERAMWLADKAMRHARLMWAEEIRDVAGDVAEYAPEARWELSDSPFVIDLVLHEVGAFADFLNGRGALLPDDEQILAAQWALVDRGVFEVESVKPGRDGGELRLRNIGTGDIVVVSGVHVDQRLAPGTVLVGRPLPVGDSYRAFSGFFPVPRARANALVDAIASGSVESIAGILAELFRPPALQNTDGDHMEIHTMTWRTATPADAVGAALADGGFVAGAASGAGVSGWLLVRDTAGNDDTMVASVVVSTTDDGTTIVGEVNSAERADELEAAIAGAVPDAEVVDHVVSDMDDLASLGSAGSLGEMPESVVPPDDPAVREAMAAMMARHEERWVDESIPALGGRTPREAVADPIGRVEVEQLLASFTPPEAGSGFVAMNPDRLRQLLGL